MYRFLLMLFGILPIVAAAQSADTLYYHIVAEPKMVFVAATPKAGVDLGTTTEQEQYIHRNMEPKEFPEDEAKHRVSMDSFYIAIHEVTFAEFDRFCMMTGHPYPSDEGWGRGKRPVINVSWYEAVAYCNWLSRQHGLRECYTFDKRSRDNYGGVMVVLDPKATGYRLPTEAEWEYAARAGQPFIFSGNDNVDKVAWYYGNTGKGTKPVCTKEKNKWGLCDMTGNVAEWCWDMFWDYPAENIRNYLGPDGGIGRVVRGGAWSYSDIACRVSARNTNNPTKKSKYFGFRLVRRAPQG